MQVRSRRLHSAFVGARNHFPEKDNCACNLKAVWSRKTKQVYRSFTVGDRPSSAVTQSVGSSADVGKGRAKPRPHSAFAKHRYLKVSRTVLPFLPLRILIKFLAAKLRIASTQTAFCSTGWLVLETFGQLRWIEH